MPLDDRNPSGLHTAIIMDGNGRWALARGLPRTAGHLRGVQAVRRVVEAAPTLGISVLTLFAFSADNWKRPQPEVMALMRMLEQFLHTELATCIRKGIQVEMVGRRDRLPPRVLDAVVAAERLTAAGTTLRLRLAVDYSARDEIVRAAMPGPDSREALARALGRAHGCAVGCQHARPVPDVDLLIRTGGEQRLSDFMLWGSAYAELYFTEVAWPEFDGHALAAAVNEFGRRQRRFGGIGHAEATAAVAS